MSVYRVQLCLGMIAVSALLLSSGCSTPPAGTGTPESRTQVTPLVRDRELEFTTLRAEMASMLIASAKKEAELQELRDLVQQLRLENAESRQAFLELRDQAEQRQRDLEKTREEQERQVQAHSTQDLIVLKDTVKTLAQELGQLRQDLAMPAARQHSSPLSAKSPMALTVTAADVPDSPSTITVQPGDTLSSLAKRHRTTIEVLRKLNVLKGNKLIVGRELFIPTSQQP